MTSMILTGLALTILGGVMQGSFTLPMKAMPRWSWENSWLVYAVVGMLLVPWAIAFATVPSLLDVYRQTPGRDLALAALFGAGWGAGSVCFGLGVARLGMALGFAIILSLTAALGSLIPMVVSHPEQLGTAKGWIILAGLGVVIYGVILCARAAYIKERAILEAGAPGTAPAGATGRLRSGLIICVLSGVLSPMLNFGLAFGERLTGVAVAHGAPPSSAANAVWAIAVGAGFLVNAGYCLYLLTRNRTWPAFTAAGTGPYWLLGAVMGLLWMLGITVYGAGAAKVGALGAVVGWPLFMATIIIVANGWGLATGEWRGAGRPALRALLAGVAALIVAITIISYGGTL